MANAVLLDLKIFMFCLKDNYRLSLWHSIFETEQSGAVEVCWAHNPEVSGSKPLSASTVALTTLRLWDLRATYCAIEAQILHMYAQNHGMML